MPRAFSDVFEKARGSLYDFKSYSFFEPNSIAIKFKMTIRHKNQYSIPFQTTYHRNAHAIASKTRLYTPTTAKTNAARIRAYAIFASLGGYPCLAESSSTNRPITNNAKHKTAVIPIFNSAIPDDGKSNGKSGNLQNIFTSDSNVRLERATADYRSFEFGKQITKFLIPQSFQIHHGPKFPF